MYNPTAEMFLKYAYGSRAKALEDCRKSISFYAGSKYPEAVRRHILLQLVERELMEMECAE